MTSAAHGDHLDGIRAEAREFAREEVTPRAFDIDRDNIIPADLLDALGDRGYLGRYVPDGYGGGGATNAELCAQQEGLSSGGCVAVGASTHATNLCADPLARYGTEEQCERFLPDLATGDTIGAIAITEPEHGSDVRTLETTAEKDGDEWVIDGRTWLLENTRYGDLFVVIAQTGDPGPGGISTFIVEADRDGFEVEALHDPIGSRGCGLGSFSMEGVRVPETNLVGEEGAGFEILSTLLDRARCHGVTEVLGATQAAHDMAVAYANDREQFGEPLGENQAIKFKLAENAAKLAASRHLIYEAARALDAGRDASQASAIANFYAADRGMEVVHEALQIFGGLGTIKRSHIERLFRDVRIYSIGQGTSELNRSMAGAAELERDVDWSPPLPGDVWD
jgi:butyryl-CoA dehydrogenase